MARNNKKTKEKVFPKSSESLESKTSGVAVNKSEEDKVIENIIGEIKVSDSYKKSEGKLKKSEIDEKDAMVTGVSPDDYYTAKGKEDAENERDRDFEETSGSFGHRSSRS